jgi:hypothetical protein
MNSFRLLLVFVVLIISLNADFEEEYSTQLDKFLIISSKQKFILSSWKIPKAWMNPSISVDPDDPTTIIIVWRMPDKGRRDKIGHL